MLDIDMKANVCCVKYNPGCSHEIAVGSADHNVHLYDLRKARAPLHVFEGEASAPGSSAQGGCWCHVAYDLPYKGCQWHPQRFLG